jgi:hypothetical protein
MLFSNAAQIPTALRDYSGSITAGGTAQNILQSQKSRCYMLIENISAGNLFVELGGARAKATLTNGVITGYSITNAGFNYAYPPMVTFLGGVGGDIGYPTPGTNQNGTYSSGRPAVATATISGGALSTIVINDGGTGFTYPPFIDIVRDARDFAGGAVPSGTSGIELLPGGSFVMENVACDTGPVSIWGATTGQLFTCKVVL